MNIYLNPGYWGSLFALICNLIAMSIIVLFFGRPDYILAYPEHSSPVALFVLVYIVVLIYVIRFYLAGSVHFFGAETKGMTEYSFLKLPSTLKTMMYTLLVTLIFFSGLNTFVVSVVALRLAIILCVIQSAIAIICAFAFWIAQHVKTDLGLPKIAFTAKELFFLFCLVLIVWSLTQASDGGDVSFVVTGGAFGLLLFIFFNELGQLGQVLHGEFVRLRERLSD